MPLRERLVAVVDRFVPPAVLRQGGSALDSARMVLSVSLLLGFSVLGLAPAALMAEPTGIFAIRMIFGPLGFVVPVIVRKTGSVRLGAHLILGFLLLGLTLGLLAREGTPNQTDVFLVAFPAAAVALAGRRAGVAWGAAAILVYLGVTVFAGAVLDSDFRTIPPMEILSTAVGLAITLAIALYFDDLLGRAARRTEGALRLAEQSDAAKTEALAHTSHEVRTPLAAVRGLSEMLLDTPLTGEQRELTEGIQRCSDQGLTLLNDILDLSKIEARRIEFESIPFAPGEILRDTIAQFNPAARQKGLTLDFEVAPGVPHRVLGDPTRVGQVLTNLLSNAIKFTAQGGAAVRVGVTPYRPGWVRLGFTVSDTGIGMDESELPRLFESFHQATPATARSYGGTGLGLAISRHLVELMGGHMTVASRRGEGATFRFEIPFPLATASDDVKSDRPPRRRAA